MKGKIILLVIILIFGSYVAVAQSMSDFEPAGRAAFVKLKNPDMYKGNPHSKFVANYTEKKGSNTALVVHVAGHTTGYPNYYEDDVYILELGVIDKERGYQPDMNWGDAIDGFIFGVSDERYNYVSDGIVFEHLDDALAYLDKKAKENGQNGKKILFYHGSVRSGSPIINQGCGFALYYLILIHEYGRLPAYYHVITGAIFPYLNSPYANYELSHISELQYYYNNNQLNYLDNQFD